jgi:beta-glucanase (GH16 family)
MTPKAWRLVAAGAVLLLAMVAAVGFRVLRAASDTGGGAAQSAAPQVDAAGAPLPLGSDGKWAMAFSDEFDGPGLDGSRWTDTSSAEADDGHGNKDNRQLEWNQAANCAVSGGELVLTAKRERFTAPSGTRYDWTSCLLSTVPSYSFQYGFIEERAILPAPKGFWPAFWTWQAPGVERAIETDVYEYYSARPDELLLIQHSGGRDACEWHPRFDPSAGWHTYGAAIEASGTTWYVDGVKVCQTRATSDGATNIITNLAVDGDHPPAGGTNSATKRVDYVRAWARS